MEQLPEQILSQFSDLHIGDDHNAHSLDSHEDNFEINTQKLAENMLLTLISENHVIDIILSITYNIIAEIFPHIPINASKW